MAYYPIRVLFAVGTVALLVSVVSFATRANGLGTDKKLHKARMHDTSVVLSATANATDNHLEIQYTVANNVDEPIYVFDKLWHRGLSSLDPQQVYRYVDGSRLRLLLGAAPLPASARVRVRNIPYVTKVDAYRVWRSSIWIKLPATEYSAYFNVDEGWLPAKVTSLELFVAYRRGRDIETSPVASATDTLKITSAAPTAGAQWLRSGPISINIGVLKNPNELFTRFEDPDER